MRLKLLITSDRILKVGKHIDRIAPLARERLKEFEEISVEYLPNDRNKIKLATMKGVVDGYDIIRISGGTGLGDRDVSVEAVRGLLDKELHLFPVEFYSLSKSPYASLGRPIAGRCVESLIIVSPGSPEAAEATIERIKKVGVHAVEMIKLKLSGWDKH